MFKTIALSLLVSSFSLSCFASSPKAWEEFRAAVNDKCSAEIKKGLDIDSITVDPEGSNSYGIAIATGVIKGESEITTQICIFNKVTEKVELGTPLKLASNNSIDIHKGENPKLDSCLNKAITSLDMNDCQSKYGEGKRGH